MHSLHTTHAHNVRDATCITAAGMVVCPSSSQAARRTDAPTRRVVLAETALIMCAALAMHGFPYRMRAYSGE